MTIHGGVASAYEDFSEGLSRASQRQFDDEKGGGAFDADTYVPGWETPGSDADVSEHMDSGILSSDDPSETGQGVAYQTVGSVTRQFDNQQGGGFGDEAVNVAQDAATDAAKAATPDWLNWVIDNQYKAAAGGLALFLFVYAGGLESGGGSNA